MCRIHAEWGEPGDSHWLISRTEEQHQIHILWFADGRRWSDEEKKTVVRMEGNLLAFAKRLAQQLGQLEYQKGKPAIAGEEYQKLKDAITISRARNLANRQSRAQTTSR